MAAIQNKIYIGSMSDPDFYFENDSIDSANVVQNVALVGKELSVDSFTPVVIDDQNELHDVYHFLSSDGHEIMDSVGEIFCIDVGEGTNVSPLIALENGTPVWYYQENTLIGKFYVKGVERVGRNQYRLDTVSAIGMLDEMQHGGGLFVASTFGTVLAHILAKNPDGTGNPVINYMIDEDVASLPVTGWLPYDTKRNNLYQLVFANGVNIVKNVDSRDDYNGCPRFTFLYTAPANAELIEVEQIYDQGSVSYEKPYTNVMVMEHTWTPLTTEDPVVLFDNTTGSAVSDTEIRFDNAPINVDTLAFTGDLHIVEDADHNPRVNENYAIVTGNGKMTGIPYFHDTRAVNMGDSSASDEKTIKVTDATFVNVINSYNLLLRLKAFYCPTNYIHKISNGIVYSDFSQKEIENGVEVIKHYTGGQRCGKVYRLSDPYGKAETAFLSSMDITASAVNKAECEWYADYVPAGQEGLYQNVKRLPIDLEEPATEGDWVVPEGVTQFKVVIIGGGTGGGSGWPGKNGEDASTYTEVAETDDLSGVWYGAEGGDGGDGGAGGSPGRVKIVTVENAVPGTTYHWTLGNGGEGGEPTGFIPDTFSELKSMLQSTEPDITYTDSQITDMVADEQTLSGWSGSPNAGSAGTASTFGIEGGTVWSSADQDAYVPTGGVYEPIYDDYYALTGNGGIKGGKGGARKVSANGIFNWVTDGEDVVGDNGETYRGGSTGVMLTTVSGLPEAKIKAYGGSGAGAAVGIDRANNPHINGNSDQSTYWGVLQDEDWEPPTPTPTPDPEPTPVYPAIAATLSVNTAEADIGDSITWTMAATGGSGTYSYYFNIYCENEVVKFFDWQTEASVTWKPKTAGEYYAEGFVKDSRNTETVQATGSGTVEIEPAETDGLYARMGDRYTNQIVLLSGGVYGPMGPNSGKDIAIIPARANGNSITVDTRLDTEINLVFKFTDQVVTQNSQWLFGGYPVEKDPRTKASLENSHLDIPAIKFDSKNRGAIQYTVCYPDPYEGVHWLNIDMFGDSTPVIKYDEWYIVNLKKVGSDYISTLTVDGNTYTLTRNYPTAFYNVFIPTFASFGDTGDYYHALCETTGTYLNLDQCYIKQGDMKIWGSI